MQQTETDVLLTGECHTRITPRNASPVSAFTIGAASNLVSWRGFDGALGGAGVFYGVPDALTETHGEHPVSFQVFLQVEAAELRSGADVEHAHVTRPSDGHGRPPLTMCRHVVCSLSIVPALATGAYAQGAASIQIAMPLAVPSQKPPAREEAVTVSATRTGARIEDVPTRVEVLNREEIEEKLLMTPGDIVMMLNEMGGMRVQTTSPGLGAATVRIQGMRGRYTRFFSDGLPLFGEVGGIGLLQIPPMDLGQVEVIKGVASSLYGAGAMGGVVNLVSRQPGDASRA